MGGKASVRTRKGQGETRQPPPDTPRLFRTKQEQEQGNKKEKEH
jgi:hypothetical protein